MVVQMTEEQKQAFARAARLLERQSEGLTETGSEVTAKAVRDYAATLRKVAESSAEVELQQEEKEQIEQASFILEGLQSGLQTADFRDRAKLIGSDARRLYELVIKYNTLASGSKVK
jgi:hypothetical protein